MPLKFVRELYDNRRTSSDVAQTNDTKANGRLPR